MINLELHWLEQLLKTLPVSILTVLSLSYHFHHLIHYFPIKLRIVFADDYIKIVQCFIQWILCDSIFQRVSHSLVSKLTHLIKLLFSLWMQKVFVLLYHSLVVSLIDGTFLWLIPFYRLCLFSPILFFFFFFFFNNPWFLALFLLSRHLSLRS